ncbi:MAG TPA: VIT1/CCC1 transporter family protein [Chitinophagaceae bacterium]|nr:VIT1/CCC1 transporter family protein [Chitinophagaceae bacterium]
MHKKIIVLSHSHFLISTHMHHHEEKHLQSSALLTDIVIGMADGLTVPFALAAGLSGAVDSTSLIVLAGIAEIAAGSIAMGLGGYLAGKTEMDHYNAELKKEYEEVETIPEKERQEVRQFFIDLGLSEDVQNKAVSELTSDKKRWVDFMMRYELNLEKPDPARAQKSAMNIGFSYIVGGIVPLSPYFFIHNTMYALQLSAIITLCCLFIFGFFKSKITGITPVWGGLRVMLIGAAAAAAAFGIAKLLGA